MNDPKLYIIFLYKGKQTEAEIYDTYFYTHKNSIAFYLAAVDEIDFKRSKWKKILFAYKIKEVAIRNEQNIFSYYFIQETYFQL